MFLEWTCSPRSISRAALPLRCSTEAPSQPNRGKIKFNIWNWGGGFAGLHFHRDVSSLWMFSSGQFGSLLYFKDRNIRRERMINHLHLIWSLGQRAAGCETPLLSAVSPPTSHLLINPTDSSPIGPKDASNLRAHFLLGLFPCHRVVAWKPPPSLIESCCIIAAQVSSCYGSRTRQQREMKADSSGNKNPALCLLSSKSIPAPSLWQMNLLLSGSLYTTSTYIQYFLLF